jgi:hypothetical protein
MGKTGSFIPCEIKIFGRPRGVTGTTKPGEKAITWEALAKQN